MSSLPSDAVLEFLALWLDERRTGRERDLAAYQALFPGAEAELAAEWHRAHAPRPPADEQPTHVAGFRLVRELGRGGQARVWLAEDERLGRNVALKLVPRSPLSDDLAPRLRREARTASRLDHPSLCTVYDAGVEGALAWIALRYVEGETLAARIAAERDGSRPRTEVARILSEGEALARALHVAHEAGVVHRDVKPGNVMLAQDGTPVLLDFGIALEDEPGVQLTLTGQALGTLAYMSPEALEERGRADARSDVWSLGVTLFEALTLARPFHGPTRAAETRAVLERAAPDASELRREASSDVALVLATALAKRPEDRYATALDFAEDLRRAREHEPLLARPPSAALRLWRWCQRRPELATSLGALWLALVIGICVSLSMWLRTRGALRESQALFIDVSQLADSLEVRRLIDGFDELWPALDTRRTEFEAWLASAERLDARQADYGEVLAAARARLDAGTARPTDAWLAEGLEDLLAKHAAIVALRPRVEAGLAFARDVRRRSIDDARELWSNAAREVAADPRFAGLALEPQIGLVPLGADPRSRLQEFAHLASGVAPRRDPATGRLELGPDTGVVLVLVPGGATQVGVRPPDDAHPAGSSHVDPLAWRWDGPVIDVELEPFFIGKYELTQGQWRRQTSVNPSVYRGGSHGISAEDEGRYPVEQVSWSQCVRLLHALDLELPSEACWEHASRAGRVTPWPTGLDVASLQGAANIADRFARTHDGGRNWPYEDAVDDGFTIHAPVGSLAPNAFGLHDTIGNVAEWCSDGFEDWATVPPRKGDGRALGQERMRPFRGGDFTNDAVRARSSARDGNDIDVPISYVGARAARALRTGGN
ncbi:MAG: SUMF1/EgtB/PvdO family nonheme iron enzyme [Planctomycetes bacterium]|nr:SUMF1/EgtB/PvdO family nonheme iron enzyme [Planctomycetota bacterium]